MWDYRTDFAGLLRKIVSLVSYAAEWIDRPPSKPEGLSKFLDLAPTDEADEDGVYAEALFAAMDKPRVFNIALTGPYGSGKSSIIKSFLKKYRGDTLQISLAAFLPESESKSVEVEPDSVESRHTRVRATKQEIERSILQQMLYGADANRLPFSRFKRIQTPGRWSSRFISLYLAIALLSCWHLFQKRDAIVKGDYFLPVALSNWFNLACFALGGSLVWLAAHRFYVASFGVSLKSVSLKDIEITPAAISQESILNRHLDEIIYFFQSTKYDLVIIEDLDRFNDPEIFVTLREINKIVNENSGVKRTIRFLYALRDDMFVNTDRTKFFEFIIPVIPIINSSNSIDMVIEQGKRLELDERLDRQFLREVSRYLSDLRLIRNIFNEYAIYVANLETDGENVLNPNKLLAVLIYKNIFPNDFEKLHRNEGHLAQVLGRHDVYVARGEAHYKAEISRLEEQIELADRQLPTDLQELRNIYAMALIEKLPDLVSQVSIDGGSFMTIRALPKSDQFDQFVASSQIVCLNVNGHRQQVNIGGFQTEVNSAQSYLERKEAVERKSGEHKSSASKAIHELRSKISHIRITKFNELIRQNGSDVEELFKAFGENGELARYLVFEGHLDDTYYQYTSLFHSGRLSPSDNKFLKQIRGYTNPEPDFQIDNPKEVVAEMRDEDFGQSYVLNVKIADCLLSEPSAYTAQTEKLFGFIASDFEKSEAFLKAYYARGVAVSALVSGLVKAWAGFVPAAMANTTDVQHMAHIIARLPTTDLAALPGRYPDLSEFVSTNLPQILALEVDFEPSKLKLLQIEAKDLRSIEDHTGVVRLLFDEGLYRLSIGNMDFIFDALLGHEDKDSLHKQHYTTVLSTGNPALIAKIDGSFRDYLENVLLILEGNSEESVEAILSTISRDDIDVELLEAFLQKQSAVVPALDRVPGRLHSAMFELQKIDVAWENCLAYISSESFDGEILTSYLDESDTVAILSRRTLADSDAFSPLRRFLINNDALGHDAYRAYVRALPKHFTKFPEGLGPEKMQILIEEGKVSFSTENFSFIDDHDDLQLLFVTRNVDLYLAKESEFLVDDDFREKLLGCDIPDEHRITVMRAMDVSLFANMPSRAAVVGPILARTGTEISGLGPESCQQIIQSSKPIGIQIALFNKFQSKLDDQQVRATLGSLQEPFSEIKPGYVTPRIQGTVTNLEFVKWLEARRIISSWSQGGLFGLDDDIRINLRRK